jgi:hypothetical protein
MLKVGKSITGNMGDITCSTDKIPMIHLIDTANENFWERWAYQPAI